MANDLLTLSDIQTINDQNLADLDVTDLLQDAPLLSRLHSQPASNGDQHKYVKETGAPVVGFRAPNAGRDWDSSEDTAVTINLKLMDATFGIDRALADTYVRGGKEALIARESVRALKKAFSGVETQLIDGVTDGDSGGFVGIREASTLEFGDAMVYNAGGTTADTASSVYFLRTGENDVSLVAGYEANIEIGETYADTILDGSSKPFPGYVTPIYGWLGLQVGSIYSMGRIVNITADSGKTLNDDMIYEALSLFPASRMPNLIVMGKRSLKQLRQSRTATNATGAPAPIPTEVAGIDIIQTDAIGATEALLS